MSVLLNADYFEDANYFWIMIRVKKSHNKMKINIHLNNIELVDGRKL